MLSQVRRVKPFMPFCATTRCVLIIGSMVATNAVVVKAAGLQILSAVTVSGCFSSPDPLLSSFNYDTLSLRLIDPPSLTSTLPHDILTFT